MNNISTRSPFFPNSKSSQSEIDQIRESNIPRRNTHERARELSSSTENDAKVTIPDSIRDFSRIKKAVDISPSIDNTEKIARLKAQIQSGTYNPDYDAIADKILSSQY